MHNSDHAHELAMMAARYEGDSLTGHSDVADKVASAYIAAYKAVMTYNEPKIGGVIGSGVNAVMQACGHHQGAMYVHANGTLHASPEFNGSGIQG